ncbi:oocyte zinc finger protein XlCOF26-like isoform X1 [Hippocampus comes]|uniref:oocyte zinc finger protein XlCOF26-like isoform X1 n=2 Tax=Hippocampus comes TaxID=109280 RepID=UPI00094E7FC0|nr:PREDICTED: oocyte zinc finger protein XlCOF26-like isoform X1 [Hippocampus comes]XP_019741761.1 PREDICTED: oocyte zinc finger protein XlCOF26-like isoform X1 [Hippocampus comes]
MAESRGDGPRRTFDFSESESEDDSEGNVLEMTEKTLPEKQALSDAEEPYEKADRPSSAKELSEDRLEDVYSIDYVIEDHGETDNGQDIDSTNKHEKFRMVCNECGTSFPRREMFYLHRHYHADKDELVPLNCLECGLSFKDRRSLMKHRHVHQEEPKYEKEARFQCAECDNFFPTAPKLRRHQCTDTDDMPYHCTLCRKEFIVRCAVAKHMLHHSEEGSWTCKECGQSFPDYRTMRCHQRCHPVLKPFECPECGMAFTHSSVMEAHRRKHTERLRSFLCPICGKTFTYKSLVQERQNLRTNEKPFRCPDCDKQLAIQPKSPHAIS